MNTAERQQQIIAQLDAVLQEFQAIKGRSVPGDLSDVPHEELMSVVTRARAAIHRIAGRPSAYFD
jgi:hypothetical protein